MTLIMRIYTDLCFMRYDLHKYAAAILMICVICVPTNPKVYTFIALAIMMKTKVNNIDQYIDTFPIEMQQRLEKIRKTIREAVPGAEEVISYQMPAFRLNGILVHFAAFQNHIGFFPTPSAIEAFKNQLSGYETSKGTIKFPHAKPIRSA